VAWRRVVWYKCTILLEESAASIGSLEYKKVRDYELPCDEFQTERRRATQAVHLCEAIGFAIADGSKLLSVN
jgi:hypothetical protein